MVLPLRTTQAIQSLTEAPHRPGITEHQLGLPRWRETILGVYFSTVFGPWDSGTVHSPLRSISVEIILIQALRSFHHLASPKGKAPLSP